MRHMICRKLRRYFEDPLRLDAEFWDEAAEHLAHCAECARFIETQRELGAGLHLLRESAREAFAALDAAVLANYRGQIAHLPASHARAKRSRSNVASWAVIAAALALAAALAIHSWRKVDTSIAKTESMHRLTVAPPVEPIKAADRVSSTQTVVPLRRRRPRLAPFHQSTLAGAAAESPESEDFRSLMYCDPLSCGGVMQVIRVQLPAPAAAFEAAANSASGTIYADVLVGPDGIARGIRVVQ
jgi:hypothetical protein